MVTFKRGPRILKGAIVGLDVFNPVASVIVFQYNPESLSRSLDPQLGSTGESGGSRVEALRFKGAPIETINAEIIVDAYDQLEEGDTTALQFGINPKLAALELLVYPKSALVIANAALSLLGTVEVVPPQAPLTLFSWGPQRVVPVSLSSYSVTEEYHDANLNPIRARVSLGMRVLTYDDLSLTNPGYGIFLAYQVMKETLAVLGSAENLNALADGSVSLF